MGRCNLDRNLSSARFEILSFESEPFWLCRYETTISRTFLLSGLQPSASCTSPSIPPTAPSLLSSLSHYTRTQIVVLIGKMLENLLSVAHSQMSKQRRKPRSDRRRSGSGERQVCCPFLLCTPFSFAVIGTRLGPSAFRFC